MSRCNRVKTWHSFLLKSSDCITWKLTNMSGRRLVQVLSNVTQYLLYHKSVLVLSTVVSSLLSPETSGNFVA